MQKKLLKRLCWIPLLMTLWAAVGFVVGRSFTTVYPEGQVYGVVIGGLVGLFWGAIFFLLRQRKDL